MPARHASSWVHKRAGHKIIPRRSGVHRTACLSLYKHLLRQIPASPLDQKLLHDVVRYEFRSDAGLRVHADVRQALTTGYRALSLLEGLHKQSKHTHDSEHSEENQYSKADQQSPASTLSEQIATLNQNIHNLSLSRTPDPEPPVRRPPPPRLWPFPGGNKILARPLPDSALTGQRHIPKLVNAGGLPFLRVKKPQPPLISKILRDKLATRQKRQDYLDLLEENLVWAKDEDEWDLAMSELGRGVKTPNTSPQMQREGTADEEKSYAATTRECIKHVSGLITAEAAKQAALAKRFWKIILQERALAEKESGKKE